MEIPEVEIVKQNDEVKDKDEAQEISGVSQGVQNLRSGKQTDHMAISMTQGNLRWIRMKKGTRLSSQ